MSIEKIEKIVKGLPEVEKKRPFVAIRGKVYTWEQALEEVKKDEDSDIAKIINEKIEELEK